MKCPLQLETGQPQGQRDPDLRDCIKQKCSWWVRSRKLCAMRVMASDIDYIEQHTRDH